MQRHHAKDFPKSRHWSEVLVYYPLHVLDRMLEAARVYVTYEAIQAASTVLQQGFYSLHKTAESAADASAEASTAAQWFFGSHMVASVASLVAYGGTAIRGFL